MVSVYCFRNEDRIETIYDGRGKFQTHFRAHFELPNEDKEDWEDFHVFGNEDYPVANLATGKNLTVGEVRGEPLTAEEIYAQLERDCGHICGGVFYLGLELAESNFNRQFAEFSCHLQAEHAELVIHQKDETIEDLEEQVLALQSEVLLHRRLNKALLKLLTDEREVVKSTKESNEALTEELEEAYLKQEAHKIDSRRWKTLYEFMSQNPSLKEKQAKIVQLRDDWIRECCGQIPTGKGSAFNLVFQLCSAGNEEDLENAEDVHSALIEQPMQAPELPVTEQTSAA